jgi:hypothetical protein
MKKIFFALATVVVIAACQKELSDLVTNAPSGSNALLRFFANNKTAPETFAVNATNPIQITGKKGAVIKFPDNAFVRQNGDAVTGDVSIEVLEIYTPAEMILNNKPTVSSGRPLVSGGQFLIRAFKNGEELKLAPGKLVNILMKTVLPVDSMVGMQVFNGTDSIVGNDTLVKWVVNNSANNVVRSRNDSSIIWGYDLFASDIQWINCDRFVNDQLISHSFDLSAAPTDSTVSLFVHITGRNSVVRIYERDGDIFKSESLIATPITIVALSIKGEQLYASFFPTSLTDKGSTKLSFEPITEDALKQRLQLLK